MRISPEPVVEKHRLSDGTAVLGIDAAWTERQPSGVALIAWREGRWQCLRVSSSYDDFSQGQNSSCAGGSRVRALLATCACLLAGAQPAVVAVDMPIGRTRITGRRPADDAVSKDFGHAKCAVHSPGPNRPGRVGVSLVRGFVCAGYRLKFTDADGPSGPVLIEVYPHVALLDLMQASERVPYKCGKTNSYWKGASLAERRKRLFMQWRRIEAALRERIDGIDPMLVRPDGDAPQARLKACEDRLDALICAWVGALYLEGKARPLGDAHSAIWVPSAAMKFARQPLSAQPEEQPSRTRPRSRSTAR